MTESSRDLREPQSPDEELLEAEATTVATHYDDAARLARVHEELDRGFRALGHIGKAVSIFGSARTDEDDPQFALAQETARKLGENGFAIITGGGPGIMEAANRGALEAGVPSIGLGIDLPHEQSVNAAVDLPLEFHYFFTRKVMFVRYASAFVVFPGGFGTFDELFEALTLRQTEKILGFPVVLAGTEYWRGLLDWLADPVCAEGKIDPVDLERIELTDDPEEIVAICEAADHRRPRAA